MLEKDKKCIEFSMRSMMLTHRPYQEDTEIAITGMVPGREKLTEPNPFDIPCDVVMVPKKEFEQLQTENEQLKKKLEEFLPVPGYSEFLKALYPEATEETIEKLVWTTNQILDCPVSANGWEENAKFWKKRYDDIFKLVGFSSNEEVEDYLVNEAECDTLQEAISKLKDQVKYTCEEWYSANSRNNSWKAAAECNTPKELMEKIKGFETEIIDLKTKNTEYACRIQNLIDDSYGRKTVIEAYKRDIERWKEATGCPSPSAAETLIESGMSYVYAYHEAQEENRKLIDDINSWKNVTGYSIPEDFLHARINCATPFDYTAAWQKATGCKTPEEVKSAIRYYKGRLGNAVQSASIATKILDNAVQSEAKAMEILEAISYIDPIKED